MELSVVIPTYNRIGMLEHVLDALEGQVNAPEHEIIVVDDGSGDGTAEKVESWIGEARFPSAPLIFRSQPNGGPGKARNHGVTLAAGRTVLFMGDDTVPAEDFLDQHYSVHEEAGHDPWVACLGYTGWPREQDVTPFMDYINEYGLQFGYSLIRHGEVVPFNFFYTSNISLSREVIANHPFDTTFPSAAWEDIELAYRLEKKGLTIRYNANAVTRHHHPTTVESFSRRQFTVGRSGAIFASKHPELRHFLGIEELADEGSGGRLERAWLEVAARAGERFSLAAHPRVFERLMRIHYLKGLEAGLRALDSSGGSASE